MAWIAGLPVLGCMLVMGLPSVGDAHVLAFRLFYAVAYLFWIVPVGWLQRWLWRRGAGGWTMAAVLLPATYAMSVLNAVIALRFIASEDARARLGWTWVFGGLDGCWLALIAFCGLQAIVLHRAALQAEGERVRLAGPRGARCRTACLALPATAALPLQYPQRHLRPRRRRSKTGSQPHDRPPRRFPPRHAGGNPWA